MVFVVAHLIYGIIVGGMYTPVHTHKLPMAAAAPQEIHEEEPVGVSHEEHVTHEEHIHDTRRR